MTLNELKYIVTLQQEGHFGRAAERCFVSQPTLSLAVKRLEDSLSIKIFDRSSGKVLPTAKGKLILKQAKRVLDEAEKITRIASGEVKSAPEPTKLGAIFTIGPYLFPKLVDNHQRNVQLPPLHIEENFTAVLRRQLLEGELDAILIALPFSARGVTVDPLYREPAVIVMAPDHPLAERSSIVEDDLLKEKVLMLGEGHCFRDQVYTANPKLARTPDSHSGFQTVGDGSSLETLRYMVAMGLGVTILPESAVNPQFVNQSIVITRPFISEGAVRTVALAYKSGSLSDSTLTTLKKSIRQCIKN